MARVADEQGGATKCRATYCAGYGCDLPAGHDGQHIHHVTPDGGVQIWFPESPCTPQSDAMTLTWGTLPSGRRYGDWSCGARRHTFTALYPADEMRWNALAERARLWMVQQ